LKPDNILIGRGSHNRHIYIIDFGLAKKYRDPQTHIHIPYCESYPLVGTTRFASINAHLGIELSRRDDIESLAYILIYFMLGSLPWQGSHSDKREAYVLNKKLNISTKVLCGGLPSEFEELLKYARALEFTQRPDYAYLHNLFSNLRKPDQENPNFMISPPSNNNFNVNMDSDSAKTSASLPSSSPEASGEGSCPAIGIRKYVLFIILFFYSIFCIDYDLAMFNTKSDKCISHHVGQRYDFGFIYVTMFALYSLRQCLLYVSLVCCMYMPVYYGFVALLGGQAGLSPILAESAKHC
jgi:serine/threonine protein kinase